MRFGSPGGGGGRHLVTARSGRTVHGGGDGGGGGLASQPRRYRVPGQPLLNRHQVGGVSRSPDGLFAQQEREPIRGRPTVRQKRTYGGRPGQRVEEQGTWAAQKHSEAGYGRPVDRGVWTAKTVKRPRQQPAHPQYANYWAPLTRKRHTMPHSAQSQHTNYWAPRTRKRHQQEHRPQRPTESSDPTQHAKGRTGDRPGPRKGATTRRNVTQGVQGQQPPAEWNACPQALSPHGTYLGGGGLGGPSAAALRRICASLIASASQAHEGSRASGITQNVLTDLFSIGVYRTAAVLLRWPTHRRLVRALGARRAPRVAFPELFLSGLFADEPACVKWIMFYQKCYPFLKGDERDVLRPSFYSAYTAVMQAKVCDAAALGDRALLEGRGGCPPKALPST